MASSCKILVLVDMNGTLCYRNEEPVPGMRSDLFIRRKHYYKRAGIETFIEGLVGCGKYEVAVYSSMMAHNIEAGLNAIMSTRHRHMLRCVLDRNMNKPDPHGTEEWDTIRDMSKVWSELPEYGPTNTLLLDNEARKFTDAPENGIVVPEFGVREVRARAKGTLDSLLAYLLQLAQAAPEDVRTYLRQHPFGATVPGAPSAAAAGLRVLPPAAAVMRLLPPRPQAAAAAAAGAGGAGGSARGEADGGLLEEAMARLTVAGGAGSTSSSRAAPAAAPEPRAAAVATASEQQDGGSPGGSPRAVADDVHVPPGTSVRFACFEGGEFLMTGAFGHHELTVRGPVTPSLRLDPRMDYALLVQQAAEAGCELRFEVERRR